MSEVDEFNAVVEEHDWEDLPAHPLSCHRRDVRMAMLRWEQMVAARCAEIADECNYGNNADGSDVAKKIRDKYGIKY